MKKNVLITGSSRGIGAATAFRAAEDGYNVCVNYVKNREAALQVVDTINQNGGKAIPYQADVSVEEDVINLFKEVD